MKNLIITVLSLFFSFSLHAQTDMQILKQAQDLAVQKKYEQALEHIETGLEKYPGHYDLVSYQVRLLLWSRRYQDAESAVEELLTSYPDHKEALELKLTGFLWQEKWQQLLVEADQASAVYPAEPAFLLLKVRALIGLSEYDAAKKLLEKVNDPEARLLLDQLLLKVHDFAGVAASHSRFSEVFDPWTILTARYGHAGKNAWDISATYGRLFNQEGLRFNANAYPVITPKLTAFLEAGYSPSAIFSNIELGAELIQTVRTLELAGGMKYLNFGADENIFIYKGALGAYFGENYASYRAYFSRVLDNTSLTHLVTLRHFLGSRYDYLQLQASLGSTPIQVNSLLEARRLDAKAVQLSYKHILKKGRWVLDAGVGVQKESYWEGQDRRRLNIQLGLSRFWE